MEKISTSGKRFIDTFGRERIFNGVNICDKGRFNGKTYEYAHEWNDDRLERLAANGVNLIRLGTTWDAIEPERGKFNDEYIDALLKICDKCAEKGMYVYLDIHQDCYSAYLGRGSDGAPKWACYGATDKKKRMLVWAEGYFIDKYVQKSFDNLWYNVDNLQDEFASMWAHLAKRFQGHPALFGYDFLNEPFIGSPAKSVCAHVVTGVARATLTEVDKCGLIKTAVKCPPKALDYYDGPVLRNITKKCNNAIADFDRNLYTPFLDKMTSAVRAAGGDGIAFVDNNYFSNLGIPTAMHAITVDGERDKMQCFAPHAYDFGVDTPLYKYASNERVAEIFAEHKRTQDRLCVPVIVGEWGGISDGDEWLPHIQFLLDLFDKNKWSFTYWESWGYLNNEYLYNTMHRPFPRAVCGEIEYFRHDRKENTFELAWEQEKPFDVPTEVFLPSEPQEIICDGEYEISENLLHIKTAPGKHKLRVIL